ncbi:phage integrase family protein [Cupriavidus basilensis]
MWLAAPLARRLRAAGIVTLADLAALCNQRGRSWWRHVPRIGPLAAERIVQILVQHSPSIGQLGAHVTGTALATPAVAAPLQASSGAAVPLEAMRLPPTLDGADGINRAPRDVCMIGARDDYRSDPGLAIALAGGLPDPSRLSQRSRSGFWPGSSSNAARPSPVPLPTSASPIAHSWPIRSLRHAGVDRAQRARSMSAASPSATRHGAPSPGRCRRAAEPTAKPC